MNLSDLKNSEWKGGFVPLLPNEYPNYWCPSIEHNPPSHMVFPSAWNWVCPHCFHKTFIPWPPTC